MGLSKGDNITFLPVFFYCGAPLMLTVSLVDIAKFGKNCKIWSKLPNLVELVKFGQNSEILLTFLNLVGLVCFSMALNPQPLINDQGRYRSGRVAKKKTYTICSSFFQHATEQTICMPLTQNRS